MEQNESQETPWTIQELTDKLGISTAIYQKVKLGAGEIAAIAEAGIKKLEIAIVPQAFDYRNAQQKEEVLNECQKQGVEIVSFHTPNLAYDAENEDERKEAVKEAEYFLKTAVEMGASLYSAHFKTDTQTRKSIDDLLKIIDNEPIDIALENVGMVKIKDAIQMVDEVASDRFHMILDIGHERDEKGMTKFADPAWAKEGVIQCGSQVSSVHLHESIIVPERFNAKDHMAPFIDGGHIAWGEVFAGLRAISYDKSLIFEDGRGENPEEWIDFTAKFPKRFMELYSQS